LNALAVVDGRLLSGGGLPFGTGGAITWDSAPQGEWEQTELKARRLIGVASAQPVGVA
jgi:para-aminobenzoate synthetase component 1